MGCPVGSSNLGKFNNAKEKKERGRKHMVEKHFRQFRFPHTALSCTSLSLGHIQKADNGNGICICLPVHCLSALSDRQPYCHIIATSSPCCRATKSQGQIPAVWILAAKLPNSDLNFAVDFLVDFFLLFFPRKEAQKISTEKSPAKFTWDFVRKNSHRISAEAFS